MVAVIGIANNVVKISVMVSAVGEYVLGVVTYCVNSSLISSAGAVYGLVTYSLYSDSMVAVIVLTKY